MQNAQILMAFYMHRVRYSNFVCVPSNKDLIAKLIYIHGMYCFGTQKTFAELSVHVIHVFQQLYSSSEY